MSRTARPTVSIVIPTFNRLDLTRDCLVGLASTAPGAEVVVTDNGSTDGTREFLAREQRRGRLRCLLNDENLGFGRACNRAAELSRGDHVLLLNNDIVPHAGWLEAMLAELEDPGVGIVGSRLLYPDGRIQHAGADFTESGQTEHVHRHADGDDLAVLESRDYPVVTGASLLVRRTLWQALGGLDEGFWMYVEDVDLCIRAWRLGYRVRYCADSVLTHFESQSSPDSSWCGEHLERGWNRFHDRWLGRLPSVVLELTACPDPLRIPRRLTVTARAAELAADPRLLAAYGSRFGAADEITLQILDDAPPGGVSGELVAAVNRAGLTSAASADLLAVPGGNPIAEHLAACGTDAVLSRAGLGEAFAGLPVFDDGSAAELHAFAVAAAQAAGVVRWRLALAAQARASAPAAAAA